MGMCLEGRGKFSVEVRRESFFLHHEDNYENIHERCSPEWMIDELDDLIAALQEAKSYIEKD